MCLFSIALLRTAAYDIAEYWVATDAEIADELRWAHDRKKVVTNTQLTYGNISFWDSVW